MGGWVGSRAGRGVLNVGLKGRVYPITGHEKPNGTGWKRVVKITPQLLYHLWKRSGTHCGPHGCAGQVQKISLAWGFNPWTVHSILGCYTDYEKGFISLPGIKTRFIQPVASSEYWLCYSSLRLYAVSYYNIALWRCCNLTQDTDNVFCTARIHVECRYSTWHKMTQNWMCVCVF